MANDRQLRAVVIGTAFGIRAHVPGLRAAGYDVVGVVGRDAERTRARAEAAGVPNACTSIEEALALGPDLVAVSPGPSEHYPFTKAALDAGCHVLCEKPFTLDIGQARDLEAQAAAGGRVACIAHEFRFTPAFATFARVLHDGAIGEPRLATIVAHSAFLADPATPRQEWWFNPARGGGWFGASGSHGVDFLLGWFGGIEAVSCRLFVTSDRDNAIDDSFDLSFVTPSGVQGAYQSSAGVWGRSEMVVRVAGRQGTVWIDDQSGAGNVESAYGPVVLADRTGQREVPVDAALALPALAVQPGQAHSVPQFARLYSVMRDEILGRPPERPPFPARFADGVACMAVLDAARASAKDGARWVAVGS